jgi:hypothetical protein
MAVQAAWVRSTGAQTACAKLAQRTIESANGIARRLIRIHLRVLMPPRPSTEIIGYELLFVLPEECFLGNLDHP